MNASPRDAAETDSPSFEQALAELEKIVEELEEGEIDLAQGLARYEQGVKLLARCYRQLEETQRKIELLSRIDADGRPMTEAFDDEAIPLEEKAQARSRRRTRAANDDTTSPGKMDEGAQLF